VKWSTFRLADFCSTSSGGTPLRERHERYYGGSIPWVKSGELRETVITSTEESITQEAIDESAAKIVPAGTLLIAMYGATVGRVGILGIDAATNQAICSVIPDSTQVNTRYLFHCLQALVPTFLAQRVGGAQPNINQEIIRNTKIPLPPVEEQRRIAAILDQAEALRAKRRQALAKLDTLTQSLFHYMFGDLTQKGVTEITFEELALSGRGMFTNGPFGSDLLTSELRDKGVPVLYIRDIRNAEFIWKSNVFVTPEKAATLPSCQVRSGDLLIAKVGDPPGAAALYPDGLAAAIITQDVIRARIDERIANPAFLQHYLNSSYGKHLIQTITVDGTRSRFSLRDLKGLKIRIPPLELQQVFAARVKRIFPLLQVARESNTVLCRAFASLQFRAFRGEL
jgi:type I restriction enzyme S subunit